MQLHGCTLHGLAVKQWRSDAIIYFLLHPHPSPAFNDLGTARTGLVLRAYHLEVDIGASLGGDPALEHQASDVPPTRFCATWHWALA